VLTLACRQWVGRVFNNNGHCGASGENCSIGEFNRACPIL
jgi:hypothetical protein